MWYLEEENKSFLNALIKTSYEKLESKISHIFRIKREHPGNYGGLVFCNTGILEGWMNGKQAEEKKLPELLFCPAYQRWAALRKECAVGG